MLYYLDRRPDRNGQHMIYRAGCSLTPHESECYALGNCASYAEAESAARKYAVQVNACFACLPSFHRPPPSSRTGEAVR